MTRSTGGPPQYQIAPWLERLVTPLDRINHNRFIVGHLDAGGSSRSLHAAKNAQTARRSLLYAVWGVTEMLGPDLQNILRRSYDYFTIMPELRWTYDGRLIYKTSY